MVITETTEVTHGSHRLSVSHGVRTQGSIVGNETTSAGEESENVTSGHAIEGYSKTGLEGKFRNSECNQRISTVLFNGV